MYRFLQATSSRVAAVIADCRYAQRRIAELQATAGDSLLRPGVAPDTYQEFLFRTSGPLTHEPSAARRSFGHATR